MKGAPAIGAARATPAILPAASGSLGGEVTAPEDALLPLSDSNPTDGDLGATAERVAQRRLPQGRSTQGEHVGLGWGASRVQGRLPGEKPDQGVSAGQSVGVREPRGCLADRASLDRALVKMVCLASPHGVELGLVVNQCPVP